MKKTRFFLVFIGFLCLLPVIFLSCYDYDQHSAEFKIKIDSITFPQTIVNSNDSLKVAFWAVVTQSYSTGHFLRFDVIQRTDTAFIAAIGYWCQGPRGLPPDCATGEQILSGLVCRVFPVQQGTYTVIVSQPDGSNIVKQIQIQ